MNAPDVVRAAHPFVEGDGTWLCTSCHLFVLDRDEHLAAQLSPPTAPVQVVERDPRESQIVWGEA